MRVLVVDDFKEWRSQVRSMLAMRPQWEIVCEASDGLEAVLKAEELKPDLILLDIGLPKLNGIEAARRIRKLVPESKILILSQERDADVAQEVIGRLGVLGYVVKASARTELLAAVEAVLQGKQFVSSDLKDRDSSPEGVKSNLSRLRVIVAPNTAIFILAQMFQMLVKGTRPNVHVVRKRPQAFALLGVTTPRFEAFEPKFPI